MVLSLANVFPLFYAPLFMSEYVYAVFIVLSRANMFTLFYVIFLERMCLRCFWYFHERICLRCFMLFFSRECVCTVLWFFHEQMCLCCFMLLFSRANVFTLFLVPPRANMFALFMLFFLERMCLRSFWYLHERMCLRCFILFSSGNCVCAISWYFHERICLRCFWHLIICLRCYDTFLLTNMFSLLYVFLWECVRSPVSNVFAFFYFTFYGLMRSYCWCYFFFLVTGEIWVYEILFFRLSCVWLYQIGVAALSAKIDALQKQVSADSVDRALECVRQLAGRPVGLSDGTAIVAALESLADVSRSAGHVDYKRHEAVVKQCRPFNT